MPDARHDQIGELLGLIGSGLDVPAAQRDEARGRYEELGQWLANDHRENFSSDARIYPQGSLRLGTAVRPIDVANGHGYDVDLVYRRDLQKESVTRDRLKEDVGRQLAGYIKYVRARGDEVPEIAPGKRCWTLTYESGFHMDVLPAIPDTGASATSLGDPLLISDATLAQWQPSNPEGFALWFEQRQGPLLVEKRRALAREANVDVDGIPVYAVPTPLRQAVQLLKRHRDIHFREQYEKRPASIIITTLAASCYANEPSVLAALSGIIEGMRHALLQNRRNGVYWVPNPTNPQENFAERWALDPEAASRFLAWLTSVESDLDAATSVTGLQTVAAGLRKAFGEVATIAAVEELGRQLQTQRDAGQLRMQSGSGLLGSSGSIVVTRHTNYGDAVQE